MDNIVSDVQGVMMDGFHQVNAVVGIVIALVAALLMKQGKQLLIMSLIATVVYAIAVVVLPVVTEHAPFRMPDNLVTLAYWKNLGALFVGFLIVIGVLYFIKKKVLKA